MSINNQVRDTNLQLFSVVAGCWLLPCWITIILPDIFLLLLSNILRLKKEELNGIELLECLNQLILYNNNNNNIAFFPKQVGVG